MNNDKQQRRFRVTLRNRIHYEYPAKGTMRFLRYDEDHDAGLK